MDIDKIKKRLETFQNNTTQKSTFLWKPPAGKSVVRITPYIHNKDLPFVELYFHFNISKGRPILSPTSYGEADPILEFANKLKLSGNREDFLLARKLEPKQRIFAPVIVRGLEEEGIKVWGFGVTVYKELCEIIADEDFGDISHPKNGHDINVQLVTPAEAGNAFGKTRVTAKPKVSPLSTDIEVAKKWLSDQPDISELYKKYTYDELNGLLKAYLSPDEKPSESKGDSDDSEEKEVVKGKGPEKKDVSEAFDELFNN